MGLARSAPPAPPHFAERVGEQAGLFRIADQRALAPREDTRAPEDEEKNASK
jgi:hypothetical protein